ncbi:MAG TPA: FHA domain-containing protein, partial [Ktedonobacterales bacterium]
MSTNAQSPGLASITFLTGPLAGTTVSITRTVTTIGRDSSNDIVVKGDPQVSRHHARLVWGNGVWRVENVSERNWISVDQQRVQQATLQPQANVGLGGGTIFVFTTRPVVQEPAAPDQLVLPASPESPVDVPPSALTKSGPEPTPPNIAAASVSATLPP